MPKSIMQLLTISFLVAIFFIACSEDKSTNPGNQDETPESVTLLAADRNGDVYIINESNGEQELFLDTWMDVNRSVPEDLGVVSAMVYVPCTNKLWLGSGGEALCQGCILTLDTSSGEASVLSTDAGQDHGIGVSGLAIHPSNGRIFSFCSDCSGDMYEIDPDTGEWDEIFSDVDTGSSGNGTTFSKSGLLYVISDDELWQVNYNDGTTDMIGELSYTGFPEFNGNRQPISALTTRPSDGTVFGILLDGGGGGNPGTSYLVRVNLQTAEITSVGVNDNVLGGLAFVPTAIVQ